MSKGALRFGWELVATVRTAVGVLEPFIDAVVTEDVFAMRQAHWTLRNAFGAWSAIVVVANDADCLSVSLILLSNTNSHQYYQQLTSLVFCQVLHLEHLHGVQETLAGHHPDLHGTTQ
jgi:hypothetical protein